MAYIHPPYYITAYEIAVKNGFTGSEEDWLASLGGQRFRHSIDIDDATYSCHVDFYDSDSTPIGRRLYQLGKIGAIGKITVGGETKDIRNIEVTESGVKVTYYTSGITTASTTVGATFTLVSDTVTRV